MATTRSALCRAAEDVGDGIGRDVGETTGAFVGVKIGASDGVKTGVRNVGDLFVAGDIVGRRVSRTPPPVTGSVLDVGGDGEGLLSVTNAVMAMDVTAITANTTRPTITHCFFVMPVLPDCCCRNSIRSNLRTLSSNSACRRSLSATESFIGTASANGTVGGCSLDARAGWLAAGCGCGGLLASRH